MRHATRRLGRTRLSATFALLAVAVACAAWAGAAGAATPFDIGNGTDARLAVAPDGRGHVVWIVAGSATTAGTAGYCRIPAGGSTCEATRGFTFQRTGGDLPSPGPVNVYAVSATKIVVIATCAGCGGPLDTNAGHAFAWTSADGGTTFTPENGVLVGRTPTSSAFGPDGAWLEETGVFVSPVDGNQVAPFAGSGVEAPALIQVGASGANDAPSVVRVPGANRLVWAASDLGAVHYATFSGAALTQSDILAPASWTTDQTLVTPEPDSKGPALSAGPSGVFLSYLDDVTGDNHLALRKLDPASGAFGPSTFVEGADAIDNDVGYPDSTQDPSGRLHAVWRSLADDGRLRYVRSGTAGTGFGAPVTLATGETFVEPEIGAGGDGNGWVVWRNTSSGKVRAVRIDLGGDPGSTPAPGTATRDATAQVPGASISFGVPGTCVQPGASFKVTLKWKRKKRKGNLFVKVTRADFYIGAKVVKRDRRAPFVQTLKVTASAKRGSTITLRARAFIKVKHGKPPKKSIRSTIKVCA